MIGLVSTFKKRNPGESWWAWLARQPREHWQPEIDQYFDEQKLDSRRTVIEPTAKKIQPRWRQQVERRRQERGR